MKASRLIEILLQTSEHLGKKDFEVQFWKTGFQHFALEEYLSQGRFIPENNISPQHCTARGIIVREPTLKLEIIQVRE